MPNPSEPPKAPTCRVVRAAPEHVGKQGLDYAVAISAEATGARAIHMQLVTIPPRGHAKPHLHEAHETALYVLSGVSGMWYGEDLSEHLDAGVGDFMYIPAGVPHQPYNPSETEPCTAVIARTDPNEQESVVLLPKLEGRRI